MIADYQSLIDVARTKGPITGKPPVIAIMRPPPLWKDSDYGMNETVLNDVMPRLVPEIAAIAGIPASNVVDVYSAMGGTDNWRQTYPICGCHRTSGMALQKSTTGAVVDGHTDSMYNYTLTQGYLPTGTDFKVGNFSFTEASGECDEAAECAGFTFRDVTNSSAPTTKVHMYLKKCANGLNNAKGWWTYLKPPSAQPQSTQPKACALFCDETSCDACHPNNVGYAVLAHTVFDFVTSVHSRH